MFDPDLYPPKAWRKIVCDDLDLQVPGWPSLFLRISNVCEYEVERDGTVKAVAIKSPTSDDVTNYLHDEEPNPSRAAMFKAFAEALPASLGDRWLDILEDAFK